MRFSRYFRWNIFNLTSHCSVFVHVFLYWQPFCQTFVINFNMYFSVLLFSSVILGFNGHSFSPGDHTCLALVFPLPRLFFPWYAQGFKGVDPFFALHTLWPFHLLPNSIYHLLITAYESLSLRLQPEHSPPFCTQDELSSLTSASLSHSIRSLDVSPSSFIWNLSVSLHPHHYFLL